MKHPTKALTAIDLVAGQGGTGNGDIARVSITEFGVKDSRSVDIAREGVVVKCGICEGKGRLISVHPCTGPRIAREGVIRNAGIGNG